MTLFRLGSNCSMRSSRSIAKGILILHTGIVLFVVIGAIIVPFGSREFLELYTAIFLTIVGCHVFNRGKCPLTHWENIHRFNAGKPVYKGPFLVHYGQRFIPGLQRWHGLAVTGVIAFTLFCKWLYTFT